MNNATAPKSNSAGAYFKAFKLIEQEGITSIPQHLQDANRDGKALGHGAGYQYPHGQLFEYVGRKNLPKQLLGTYFFQPSNHGYESEVATRLTQWRRAQQRALGYTDTELKHDLSEEEIKEIKGKHKAT